MAKIEYLDLTADYDDDIVTFFTAFLMAADLNTKIRHVVLGDKNQKTIIKTEITKPSIKHLTNIDLIITVNHEVFELLEDEDKQILVHSALNGLHYDLDKEVLKNNKSSVGTGTAKRYGIEKLERVNDLVKKTYEQKKDNKTIEA